MENSQTIGANIYREALTPDRQLTVSQWADEFRYLSSKASAESGKWKTERTPYLKAIMDALSVTNRIQTVVFQKGSQIGGTECGNNWIGYIIDHAPAPIMAIQPTIDMAKRNSKQRIGPLIDETPSLKEKVGEKSRKDSSNNMLEKEFPGGLLILAGANSAAGLKSTPARFVFFDEIDEYPADLDSQGDPIELAKARSRTFARRKWFLNGTPTVEGQSNIDRAFKDTNQQFYNIPCPECGFYQKLEFKQLKWKTSNNPGSTKKLAIHVFYECIEKQCKIKNWQKTKLLKAGRWVAEKETGDRRTVGFHLSALYSPVGWYSWEEIAQDWLDAQGKEEKLKTFINTVLGESWKQKSETPVWNRLYERRENYEKNLVPDEVCFLTCGADVQRDRIELEIVGWSREKISYSIDYRVIMGDTSKSAVWKKLDEVAVELFPKAGKDNINFPIKMLAIDSGFATQTVYNWVRKYPTTRVVAVKGSYSLNLIHGIPKAADVKLNGKTIARGLRVWPVGVSIAKDELYGWLRQSKNIDGERVPFGYCFFPEYDPEFFKMLTAESLVTKFVRGFKRTEWIKDRERNEALDCRVYARAAASICGMDRFKDEHWGKMESDLKKLEPKPVVTNQPTKKTERKKKRESIW
jgi:phage terminase large subunit GpA-like protein